MAEESLAGAKARAATVDVRVERRDDGTIILTNGLPLPAVAGTIPGKLKQWAAVTPEALFLSQGDRLLTYAEGETIRRRLAERLMGMPISFNRPIMIVAENGINHALLMLAATSVCLPVAIVSTSYIAAGASPWMKFGRVISEVEPAVIVADDVTAVRAVLATLGTDIPVQSMDDLAWIENAPAQSASAVDAAEARVDLDTIAKLLFTSGSTGKPKAVPNTQRMMVSNMLGLSAIWPFLSERRPVSVDWLPWNHTFGGNCCFNITLWFGGHSHIDSGRPSSGAIGRSIEALKRWRPNLYYNVPVGFEALLPILESDDVFARRFFSDLDFIFNGGAPIPSALRTRMEAVSRATTGDIPAIVAGWGSTETAPFATVLYFEQPHANNLGAPMPGTSIKMVPEGERFELRVKGPNVTPGYWRDPGATADAFDEEGYYKIGDAARFVDPDNPAAGIVYDGRVAENFKLISGTCVNVGALRLAVLSASEKLMSDAVVAGEGRNEIGLLVFPNEETCREFLGPDACAALGNGPASAHPAIRSRIEDLLKVYNAQQMGSSTRVTRFVILQEPPNAAHDEITDKGYINQRKVLSRRADLIEELYR